MPSFSICNFQGLSFWYSHLLLGPGCGCDLAGEEADCLADAVVAWLSEATDAILQWPPTSLTHCDTYSIWLVHTSICVYTMFQLDALMQKLLLLATKEVLSAKVGYSQVQTLTFEDSFSGKFFFSEWLLSFLLCHEGKPELYWHVTLISLNATLLKICFKMTLFWKRVFLQAVDKIWYFKRHFKESSTDKLPWPKPNGISVKTIHLAHWYLSNWWVKVALWK